MLIDMLIVLIIISIILFIFCVYTMDENPMLAFPLIMVNMIFIVIVAYGFWDVEWFYTGYNVTTGAIEPMLHSTYVYGTPYSYVFFVFFLIHCLLFAKTGFNMWQEAAMTKGRMDYKKLRHR